MCGLGYWLETQANRTLVLCTLNSGSKRHGAHLEPTSSYWQVCGMLVELELRFPFEKGLAEGRWSRDWRFGSSTIDPVREGTVYYRRTLCGELVLGWINRRKTYS
jgi:hypothetical protein